VRKNTKLTIGSFTAPTRPDVSPANPMAAKGYFAWMPDGPKRPENRPSLKAALSLRVARAW